MMRKIFLDHNHWIALSRAYYGKSAESEHSAALDCLRMKIADDDVILPLQISHLVEFSRCSDASRRQRMAVVFEEFSRRWFFGPWSEILRYEFSLAVATTFGTQETVPRPELFGRGVLFSLGTRAKSAVLGTAALEFGLDLHETLAACPGALFDLLTFANEAGRARQVSADRQRRRNYAAACERDRSPANSFELTRRAQAASYTYEHQQELQLRLVAAGRTFDDFRALGPEGMSAFFDRVPSLDVDRALSVYRDRQWTRKVEGNDLNDIGYLALAIPYCSAVVVERFWGHAIRSLRLDRKYDTRVFTDLGELPAYLM